MTKSSGRQPASDRLVELPELSPFGAERIEARRDYDTTDFVDCDFSGQDAPDVRFLECRLQRCNLDGVTAAAIDLADSTWRDSEVVGGRLGACDLAGSNLTASGSGGAGSAS